MSLWLSGIIFIILYVSGMFLAGHARGWSSPSGYAWTLEKDGDRFLPEPAENGNPGEHARNNGASSASYWYYWQTKPENRTWLNRFLPWLGYILHQFSIWLMTFFAQAKMNSEYEQDEFGNYPDKYTPSISHYNVGLLVTNILFYLLHLGITHWTYDGLAIDTVITSGQSSVSAAIALIFLLEYRDRGMFLAYPQKSDSDCFTDFIKLDYNLIDLFRKYHGYCFQWIMIWTLWYHPLENTSAHATGCTIVWLFLLQGSLIFTQFHYCRPWRFLVEIGVFIHGPVVAYQIENAGSFPYDTNLSPMFFFGFGMCVVATQIFTFQSLRNLAWYFRIIPLILFWIGGILFYLLNQNKNFSDINEMVRIPPILYLTALASYFSLKISKWILHKIYSIYTAVIGVFFSFFILILFAVLFHHLEWTQGIDFTLLQILWTIITGVVLGFAIVCIDMIVSIYVVMKEPNPPRILTN